MHSQNPPPESLHVLVHLPEEIIEEIVSRLPVKSLLRFRCISKSWLSLIKSDRFIKIHLKNSTKNSSLAHHRVVFNGYRGVSGCSLQSLLNSNSIEGSSSSCTIIVDPTKESLIVVGCCNGVLCLLSTYPDDSFSIWNPTARVSIEVPKLGRIYPKLGFGWDESSGAFKVFATTKDDSNKLIGKVYSWKTNSWKTVPLGVDGYDSLFNYFGVFVCGRIHWAVRLHDKQYAIESFNLENDEFERIDLPPSATATANANACEGRRPDMFFGEVGGCLCTLFDDDNKKKSADVWVMKEYGVKDSWFKLLTFPLDFCCPKTLIPLFDLNGEMFIIWRDIVMVYSPKHDVFSKLTNFDTSYQTLVYVESLVSPLGILGGSGTTIT